MPELPEVQTVITYLNTKILNKPIIKIIINNKKFLKNFSEKDMNNSLINNSFRIIERRGKYLIFNLSNGDTLVSHLRMEGKYFYCDNLNDEILNKKHNHIIYYFSDNSCLIYNDSRQFGTFNLYNKETLKTNKELSKLGVEPFTDDFNLIYLKSRLMKSSKKIKTFLLDQTIIVGIGNIYADEILFASKINPERVCKSLKDKEIKDIIQNTNKILKLSIENKGTTINTYQINQFENGNFQNFLKVHTKAKTPCINCSTLITKIKVNGRGTYYCQKCQK